MHRKVFHQDAVPAATPLYSIQLDDAWDPWASRDFQVVDQVSSVHLSQDETPPSPKRKKVVNYIEEMRKRKAYVIGSS